MRYSEQLDHHTFEDLDVMTIVAHYDDDNELEEETLDDLDDEDYGFDEEDFDNDEADGASGDDDLDDDFDLGEEGEEDDYDFGEEGEEEELF